MIKLSAVAAALAVVLVSHGAASADDGDAEAARMEKARFSGKRMFVEVLAGEVAGALAAYGTYKALCDGEDCFGAGLAAVGANWVVAPLAVWGTGNLLGGEGKLGWTYLGAAVATAPLGVTGPPDETPGEAMARIELELAISTILMPITSALMYELSSNMVSARWRAEHAPQLAVRPTHTGGKIDGAMGSFGFAF